RLAAFIALRREATAADATESLLGLDTMNRDAAIAKLIATKQIIGSGGAQPSYVTIERFSQLKQKLLRVCRRELRRRKPASQVPLVAITAAMSHDASESMLAVLLDDMVTNRELVRRGDRVGLPSGAQLSQRQRQLLAQLLSEFSSAGRAPPTDRELAEKL